MAQAEAAVTEHYSRLARLAYLLLPCTLAPHRRVRLAHALTQRALPRGRTGQSPDTRSVASVLALPGQRRNAGKGGGPEPGQVAVNHDEPDDQDDQDSDPGYGYVRLRVVRGALEAGMPRQRPAWPRRWYVPPPLPVVWGLRLVPPAGGARERALDQRLSQLPGPARAAYLLRALEGLTRTQTRRVLSAAGVTDPEAALSAATTMPGPRETDDAADDGASAAADSTVIADSTPDATAAPSDSEEHAAVLLAGAVFDPCRVRARPTDLLQRRQRFRTAWVTACVVLVCGALWGVPGQGGEQDQDALAGPAGRARRAMLDPGKLIRVAPAAWRTSPRTDYSVWPTRGALTGDRALLRRALAVWARPGARVRVAATPGTPAGGPPGPAQLLYADRVNDTRVVLFHDGLRVVRYAEPVTGGHRVTLGIARTDGARDADATALVVDRAGGALRYLTAPWVRATSVRDLLHPDAVAAPLRRSEDGVTAPVPAAARSGECRSWPVLQVRDGAGTPGAPRPAAGSATPMNDARPVARLFADLGEPVPAHLTAGSPTAPGEARGPDALADWAHLGCSLAALRAQGVQSVNSWRYAHERLPEANGTAFWLCARADTWRGTGNRVLVAFRTPGRAATAVVARAKDSPACGRRTPQVLAGVLWKSTAGNRYLLAAGSRNVASIAATGTVRARTHGHALAVPAERSAEPGSVTRELAGRLTDGTRIAPPH